MTYGSEGSRKTSYNFQQKRIAKWTWTYIWSAYYFPHGFLWQHKKLSVRYIFNLGSLHDVYKYKNKTSGLKSTLQFHHTLIGYIVWNSSTKYFLHFNWNRNKLNNNVFIYLLHLIYKPALLFICFIIASMWYQKNSLKIEMFSWTMFCLKIFWQLFQMILLINMLLWHLLDTS